MTDEMKDVADAKLHPPTTLLIWIIAGILLNLMIPLIHFPGWLRALGVLDVLAALGFFAWALGTFRRIGADVKLDTPADALATDGPYAFSRNPIYLAMLVLGLGLGFALSNLWLILSAPIFWWLITEKVIKPEETYMARTFGKAYDGYCSKVRRWI